MAKTGGGSIVNISSIMGFVGGPSGHPAYSASKGAVRIYTKSAAALGIRVNSVHPGYMPPMLNATNANKRADKIAATPLRRLGKPIEVSYGVLFLASDEASFGTGTELVIDVGYIASRPGAMPNIDTRRISLFSRLPGAAEFLSCSCTNLAAAAKAGARLPRF
jgi:NAD(P)-dependent dehydrogenase (short-subunit alcohol dehydrogenase family)